MQPERERESLDQSERERF